MKRSSVDSQKRMPTLTDIMSDPPGPAEEEGLPGIYVHIPFCLTKCPYCSFFSQPYDEDLACRYLAALKIRIAALGCHPWTKGRNFGSLYIGGGTPTIYRAKELEGLVETCLRNFSFVDFPEISVETNPNTVNLEKLRALGSAGVNRLSLGVQSFSDQDLTLLGRSHTATEAGQAINLAGKAGFSNINIDLMFGLPGQGRKDWTKTLETTLKFSPEHLSIYELTIEEETPFFSRREQGELSVPGEETLLAMADITSTILAAGDYIRYEISNFARPGFSCRHNIMYWENGSYLGLGAGAVSCSSGFRVKNIADVKRFIEEVIKGGPAFSEGECLMRGARFRESVVIGMRMLKGVSIERLTRRFGIDPGDYYHDILPQLTAQGYIEIIDGNLRLSRKGLPLTNQILSQLV